jgi:hypothetical protein
MATTAHSANTRHKIFTAHVAECTNGCARVGALEADSGLCAAGRIMRDLYVAAVQAEAVDRKVRP